MLGESGALVKNCIWSAALTQSHAQKFVRAPMAHRTLRKAELFCEICMMDQAAVMIARNAMDAYDCWLFPESPMQLEGALRKRQICRSPFF